MGIRESLLNALSRDESAPPVKADGGPEQDTAGSESGEETVRVVVGFSSREGAEHIRSLCERDEWYFRSNAIECTVPEEKIDDLETHTGVRYVERPTESPTPDAYSWGAQRIRADIAHEDNIDGTNVDICIVDSGINSTHPELAPNLGIGYVAPDTAACDATCPAETVDCTETWDDDSGHGSKMASVAAGAMSANGYTGVSHNATLHAAKAWGCAHNGSSATCAQGIEWAAGQGYDVISMSFSFSSSTQVLEDAVEYAAGQGCTLVGSAGNQLGSPVRVPAAYDEVIAVTAVDQNDQLAEFSNEGSRVTVTAPGVDIPAANFTTANGYVGSTGTSPAAAFTSGVAGLVIGGGAATPDAVRAAITDGAEDIGLSSDQQGAGLIDAIGATGGEYIDVRTHPPTNVTDVSATLQGETVTVEGPDSLDAYFEWREVGALEWNETEPILLPQSGASPEETFSTEIEGLNRESDYEVRAVAVSADRTATATAVTFTTEKGFGWPNDPSALYGVTDANGEYTFANLPEGEYELQAGHDSYEILHEFRTHSGAGNWDLWLDPRGVDAPDRSTPDVPAFFEVAALNSRAGDDWQIDVLVSNTGTNPGTDIVSVETPDGETVARHNVQLDGLEHTTPSLSVRSVLEDAEGGTAEVIISTTDDEEHLEIEATGHVAEVTGPGQPRTAGGANPGTLGGSRPTTLGRERDQSRVDELDIARKEGGFAITLENLAGARRHLTDVVKHSNSFDPTHTEISKWSFQVPVDSTLDAWDYQTKAYITSNRRLLAVGWVNKISSDKGDKRTTIEGRGPEHEIHAGPLTGSTEWSHNGTIQGYRAIERCAAAVAPEWDISVVRPADPILLEDPEVSGSPWECLVSICEDPLSYRLSVDQQQFRQATAFPPGGVVRNKNWVPEDGGLSRESSRGSYFPAAEVRGAHTSDIEDWPDDEDDRYVRGEYTDWTAVARLADEQNITESEARQVFPISDPSIESPTEANAVAQGKVRELTDENTIGGEIETLAEFLPPGVSYPMPWDDSHKLGIHALRFASGGGVDLPPRALRPLRARGTLTMWVKAPWSDLSNVEARLFHGSPDDTTGSRGITTISSQFLSFQAHDHTGSTLARAAAAPGGLPDDEWVMPYFQWRPGDRNTTEIRAGHIREDGTHAGESAVLEGEIAVPYRDRDVFTLGRTGSDHWRGTMDTVSLWEVWLGDDDLETLGDAGTLPSANLVSKYPMDEGPQKATQTVYDERGGFHGVRNEYTRPSGQPQTLRSQSIDGLTMTAQFSRSQTFKDALKAALRD